MTEAPKISSRRTLALTQQELDYLQQFLDAHDRAGFYIAYNALTSTEFVTTFGDADFGKREASLQAKIASFSEEVGAAAYLANRLLQEQHRDNGYEGIYYLSQQVAQSAMDAILADRSSAGGDGLLTDKQFFNSAVDAWRINGVLAWFPGRLFYAYGDGSNGEGLTDDAGLTSIPGIIDNLAAGLSALFFVDGNLQAPTREAFLSFVTSDGAFAAILAPMYLYLIGGQQGKRVDNVSDATTVTTPDGSLTLAIVDDKVISVESDDPYSSDSKFESAVEVIPPLLEALARAISPVSTDFAKAVLIGAIRGLFDPYVPYGGNWEFLNEPFGDTQPTDGDPASHLNAIRAEATSDGDTLFGTDSVFGIGGDDVIDGGAGNDAIIGGGGDDQLAGGEGNDILWGQDDDDILSGGRGDDVLRGGIGNDLLRPGEGSNIVDGGDPIADFDSDGVDTADYSDLARGISITIGGVSSLRNSRSFTVSKVGSADIDTLHSVEKILVTKFADTLTISELDSSWKGINFVIDFLNPDKGNKTLSDLDTIDLHKLDHAYSSNDVINFKNAENILLTDFNDTIRNDVQDGQLAGEIRGYGGDDSIELKGGNLGVVSGGLGKDWIYNTSDHGEVWGDIRNSQIDKDRNRYYVTTEVGSDGKPKTVKHIIADDKSNSDNFWWSSTTTIKDAGKYDVLKFFGIPLVGGDSGGGVTLNALSFGLAGLGASVAQGSKAPASQIFVDFFLPFITYSFERKNGHLDMLVGNVFERIFSGFGQTAENTAKGVMRVENVDAWFSYTGSAQSSLAHKGSLGMAFKVVNPIWDILAHLPETLLTFGASGGGPLVEFAMTASAAASRFYEAAKWKQAGDPLILDLDGDGIETVAIDAGGIYFDLNQNLFRERTGWVSGDDGLLALDRNGNGAIDNGAELFGTGTGSGFADLAVFDLNHDGMIDAADAVFADLRVWQDVNQDGVSQAGELHGLADLGIVSITLSGTVLDGETNDGTVLRSAAGFLRADGSAGTLYEAIFQANHTDTRYAGESGAPAWATTTLNAKGFGSITDLAVAMANDADLGQLAASRAAAMTVPKLSALVAQAGDVLGAWGSSLELTRELYAVRLSADGKTLLERQAWDGAALAAGWSLEQGWSPATRGALAALRTEAPYLTRVVNGRAVILDYGILQADGTWKLASDSAVTYASKEAITALTHPAGTEWRTEEIGFNPYAELPVDHIGVRFTDGQVVDYTVQVTDADGTFYVWARNLDRALQLEWKTGDSREFQLRNYAITFAELDEVNSSDDSTFRVELLTPARPSRHVVAADNDNDARREAAFCFAA